jgi:hypothetical protein
VKGKNEGKLRHLRRGRKGETLWEKSETSTSSRHLFRKRHEKVPWPLQ